MDLKGIASIALSITQVVNCAVLLIKPLREWVIGVEDTREGERCLLRTQFMDKDIENL